MLEKNQIQQEPRSIRSILTDVAIDRNLDELDYIRRILLKDLLKIDHLKGEKILIADVLKYKIVSQGENIFKAGDRSELAYIIISGRVRMIESKLMKSLRGNDQPNASNELIEGNCFGEEALKGQHLRTHTAVAMMETELATLDTLEYMEIIQHAQNSGMNQLIDFCEKLPYFQKAGISNLCKLEFVFQSKKFPNNQYVIKQGDITENIYIIRKGEFEMEIDLDSLLSVGNMDESGAAGIPQLNEFLNNEEETKRNNFMERTRNFCVNQASSEQKLKHKFFKTNSLKLSRNALKICILGVGQMFGADEILLEREKRLFSIKSKSADAEILVCSNHEFISYIIKLKGVKNMIQQDLKERENLIFKQIKTAKELETLQFILKSKVLKRQKEKLINDILNNKPKRKIIKINKIKSRDGIKIRENIGKSYESMRFFPVNNKMKDIASYNQSKKQSIDEGQESLNATPAVSPRGLMHNIIKEGGFIERQGNFAATTRPIMYISDSKGKRENNNNTNTIPVTISKNLGNYSTSSNIIYSNSSENNMVKGVQHVGSLTRKVKTERNTEGKTENILNIDSTRNSSGVKKRRNIKLNTLDISQEKSRSKLSESINDDLLKIGTPKDSYIVPIKNCPLIVQSKKPETGTCRNPYIFRYANAVKKDHDSARRSATNIQDTHMKLQGNYELSIGEKIQRSEFSNSPSPSSQANSTIFNLKHLKTNLESSPEKIQSIHIPAAARKDKSKDKESNIYLEKQMNYRVIQEYLREMASPRNIIPFKNSLIKSSSNNIRINYLKQLKRSGINIKGGILSCYSSPRTLSVRRLKRGCKAGRIHGGCKITGNFVSDSRVSGRITSLGGLSHRLDRGNAWGLPLYSNTHAHAHAHAHTHMNNSPPYISHNLHHAPTYATFENIYRGHTYTPTNIL